MLEPDPLEEVGEAVRVVPDLGAAGADLLEREPEVVEGVGEGVGQLEAAIGPVANQPDLDRALEVGVGDEAPALGQLLALDRQRRWVTPDRRPLLGSR